uniref:RNA polymerase III subunit Rpc25 domain-containing protein n=1 Tax=Zooxanthella nutricula TaxID=1333877 RepID=A0A6V0I3X3_9DINO|mmetsp:Transcript_770/g.2416  ORF Transcript_770/g.2416 Transcript_770/m.2416 type:complete len:201 (+) Transcript_770:54-656(+)
MFTLVLIDDDIPVQPTDFRDDYRVQLKRQIESKYVDRVIPNAGLCIAFYDFANIKDAIVYPGDGKLACGEAYFKVEFNLVVFRPIVDEWLVGSLSSSTEKGLSLSLGFFQEVEIPSSNLRTPYTFDALQQMWVWQYRNADTMEHINFFYEKDELVRFRVMSVDFPEATGPEANKRETPMKIVGAVDRDGLGCVSWWPENE